MRINTREWSDLLCRGVIVSRCLYILVITKWFQQHMQSIVQTMPVCAGDDSAVSSMLIGYLHVHAIMIVNMLSYDI